MVSEMQRIAVVVLLSIALVLVSGQAEATTASKMLPNLSGKMQKLRSQVRKMFESEKAVTYSLLAVSLGTIGIGISSTWLSEHTLVQILFTFTGISFIALGKAINANLTKKHYVAAKDAGKAYRLGENNGSYQVIKMLAESKPEHEPVEVNNRTDMLLKIFMWVQPPFAVNMPHIDALIDKKGGFPLTVASDGLTFDSGVFISYTDLFGEEIFSYRTDVETEEMPTVADN